MSLNITNTANTLVKNCSGGEQKRVAIAQELAAEEKPNLFCIDEPTSGLDSCAAEELIHYLKDLTNRGIAVVTSIHQPSNDILFQFDTLYVMSIGGQNVFSGSPSDTCGYITICGINVDDEESPIEMLVRISCTSDDQIIQRLVEMTKTNSTAIEDKCIRDCVRTDRIPENKVPFNFKHFWYLTVRSLIINYQSHLHLYIFTLLVYILLPYYLTKIIDQDAGVPSGCLDPGTYSICNETAIDLKTDYLLQQNSELLLSAILFSNFIMIIIAIFLGGEHNIFINERNNGMSNLNFYKIKVKTS